MGFFKVVHAEEDEGAVVIVELAEAKLQFSHTFRPQKVRFQQCPHSARRRWVTCSCSRNVPRLDCLPFLILGTA